MTVDELEAVKLGEEAITQISDLRENLRKLRLLNPRTPEIAGNIELVEAELEDLK